MSRNERFHSLFAKFALILVGVAGLWLLGTWLLSAPQLSASGASLALLTFRSPIGDPELALVKTVDNDNPDPGEVIEYTLTFSTTNDGSQVFNVRLYDFLPAGVEPVDPMTYDGMVMFTVPTVSTTNVITTVQVRVLEGYERLYNHAFITADFVAPTHASLWTDVDQPPLWLSLSKIGHTAVLTGSELVYELRCENTSDVTVNDVTMIDVLPGGVSLVDAFPSPEVSLPVLSWSVGDLAPGAAWEAVITTTAPNVAGMITNTALADARQRVMTRTILATRVLTEAAILQVTKLGSTPKLGLGHELVYTLRYENIGNLPATDVVLTDTLPADITVMGVSTSTASATTGQLVWNIGVLSPTNSGEVVITVTVQGMAGRWLHNVADIAGQPGSFPDQDELYTRVRLSMIYLPVVMRNYGVFGD